MNKMNRIDIKNFELDLISDIQAPITIWEDTGEIDVYLHPKELEEEEYENLSEEEETEIFINTFNSYVRRMQADVDYIENNKQKIIDFLIEEKVYNNLQEHLEINGIDCIKFKKIYFYIDDEYAEDDLGDTDEYEVSIYIRAEGENIDQRTLQITFDKDMNMMVEGFSGGREIKGEIDFNNFFTDSKEYTVSKGVTDEEIKKVEDKLGYKLPKEYIDLMKVQNGGIPVKKYFQTEKETSWGEHHICIDALYGIGDDTKSDFVIRTWEYPNAGIKGIIIAPYIAKGNVVLIMNYRKSDEPEIAYVDVEYGLKSVVLATSLTKDFKSFLNGLVSKEELIKENSMITKKYVYDYEDYEDGNKDAATLIQEVLADPQLSTLDEIVIGCWGECYVNSAQVILDTIVEEKEKFKHIRSLYIGDMTYEECEVSWIEQGDYSKLWGALPQLERLIIKGSQGLTLGNIVHNNLKSLEIICGGLPQEVLHELAKAQLPNLEKLNIYIGVDNYGFSGDLTDIEKLISHLTSFKKLTYLGIGNSEIQDEIVEKVLLDDIIKQLEVLDFSNGTLSDKGGKLLLENKDKLMNLQKLDLHHHFLSDKMMHQLAKIGIMIDLDEQNEDDEEYGNYPMLTE